MIEMALPTLTPEQRADALRKATEARRARAAVTQDLANGVLTLQDVWNLADVNPDGPVARTRTTAILRALPGVGPVRAERMMTEARVAASRRVAGLSERQRSELVTLAEKSTALR